MVVQTRCIDEIWFHDQQTNPTSIWIALVGSFNKTKPTEEQYEALNMLLTILKQQFTGANVQWHWWWWSSCPWKLFDKNKIIDSVLPLKVYWPDWDLMLEKKNPLLWAYEVTRYYSPEQWQEKYYAGKTYEQDVTMNCGASAIGNDGCLQPAYWPKYTNEDAKWSVACGSQFPAYTKFKIKDYGWVTCRDRGSAIVGKKLDLWMWFGMTGLNNINNIKRPAGTGIIIEEILFPSK